MSLPSVTPKPVVYSTDGPWSQIAPYFAKGAKCPMVPASAGLQPDTIGIFWGLLRGSPELIKASIQAFQPWFYLDHGYFKRGHFNGHYRITYTDFQQRHLIERPDDRWKKLGVSLTPWRTGRKIVICPPSDHVCAIFNCRGWEQTTVEALKSISDRPIIIRRKSDPMSFTEAIKDAHCLVTSSSIAAVEAVLSGVPVFVAQNSAAAPVGLVDLAKIEEPIYPDREPWCHSLAYGQFTREEMKDGAAWAVLQRFTTL